MTQRRLVQALAVVLATGGLVACSSNTATQLGGTAVQSKPAGAATTAPAAVGATTTLVGGAGDDGGVTKFCDDAQAFATELDGEAKDVAGGADVTAPSYISAAAERTLPLLLNMQTDAPAEVLPVVREYFGAYADYISQLTTVGFVIPPPDPAGQKVVQDATDAYGPVALADLPKIEAYVQSTCGIALNLHQTP